MIHIHVALWISGSPRIDKVVHAKAFQAADQNSDDAHDDTQTSKPSVLVSETVWADEGGVTLKDDSAARALTAFHQRIYTEWNIFKANNADASRVGTRRKGTATSLQSGPVMMSVSLQSWLLATDSEPLSQADEAELHHLAEFGNGLEHWKEIAPWLRSEDQECKLLTRLRCRLLVVGILAEWLQMHDLHEPFPMGPPSKTQPCCQVEHEMTSQERRECNKLFPRVLIGAGCGKISEDPRRRELYRLWLSRNCHFVNNYIPLLLLATQSNVDIQAVTTKHGVIEYMTKYMTKSGQGPLLTVMMDSFAKCLEKAADEGKGVRSAAAKFFNIAATQDQKCQLETMHLAFRLPRYFCSREFNRLSTRSKARRVLKAQEVSADTLKSGVLVHGSNYDNYLARDRFDLPKEAHLHEIHCAKKLPLWHLIASSTGEEFDSFEAAASALPTAWVAFRESLSWWEFKLSFKGAGNSLRLKPKADVILISHMPRLNKADNLKEHAAACREALLTFCNHGPNSRTFQHVSLLDEMVTFTIMAAFDHIFS